MQVLAIANQKGGVGKTTTAVNLSAAISKLGKRILLIDMDPQSCASMWLTGKQAEPGRGIYRIVVHKADLLDEIIHTEHGIDLVLASVELAKLDIELIGQIHNEHRLEKALTKVQNLYDYIILDCPPSLALAAINAFVAAQTLIVPVDCRGEAYQAISRLMGTINAITDELGRGLEIYVLPTFAEPTRIGKEVREALSGDFPDHVLPAIRKNTRLAEAYLAHQPICSYDTNASGTADYANVANRLVQSTVQV